VELPLELLGLLERLAANAHDVWAAQRLRTAGPSARCARRQPPSPCLVSYEELPESEKEYDRNSVRQTLRAILRLGYRIGR
jgi:ryanodine receptor 2